MKNATGYAMLVVFLAGCPPASHSDHEPPQKPLGMCTKEGQNCEYSPGKIGLCTARPDGCDDGPCLSCMSLH